MLIHYISKKRKPVPIAINQIRYLTEYNPWDEVMNRAIEGS